MQQPSQGQGQGQGQQASLQVFEEEGLDAPGLPRPGAGAGGTGGSGGGTPLSHEQLALLRAWPADGLAAQNFSYVMAAAFEKNGREQAVELMRAVQERVGPAGGRLSSGTAAQQGSVRHAAGLLAQVGCVQPACA